MLTVYTAINSSFAISESEFLSELRLNRCDTAGVFTFYNTRYSLGKSQLFSLCEFTVLDYVDSNTVIDKSEKIKVKLDYLAYFDYIFLAHFGTVCIFYHSNSTVELVKTENIETARKTHAMGMTIHLEGYNASNKWVFGTIARPCVSGTSKDWVKVEGVTPVISESITSAFIQPLAHGCVSGYGVVDNIYVAELETKPVGAIFSDAYRNESAGGKVKFSAALDIDRKIALENYAVEFAYVAEGGHAVKTSGKIVSHSDATVELDTGIFAVGTNDVVCTLSCRGKEIGSASLRFARLKAPTPRKVYVDRNRICYILKPRY